MMLLRLLLVETMKLKRTVALGLVFVCPFIVVVMQFVVGYVAWEPLTRGGRPAWPTLASNVLGTWGLLMLPLFVTVETALAASLEHADRNWKHMLVLPPPRWMVYVSKLLVMVGAVAAAHLVLAVLTIGNGYLLAWVQPRLRLGEIAIGALAQSTATVFIASLFAIAIQHFVSLRVRSLAGAVGFGICAVVIGITVVNSDTVGRWFPWSMPMHATRAGESAVLLAVSALGTVLVTIAACVEFSRRDFSA
jgi:hypothetical protein